MQKEFIKNRKGQKVCTVVYKPDGKPQGLAFVVHGLSGYKEEKHLQVMKDAFLVNAYTVVMYDATNTFGESDGNFEDATFTAHYADLEDVITWAGAQKWYREPFVLAGHSMGSMAITYFAENYPEKVKALAPTSTSISGKLSMQNPLYKKILPEWQKTDFRIWKSSSRGGINRLKYTFVEDRLKYDNLEKADRLSMPVLMVVGDEDESAPPEHQRILYEKLTGKKELHIIKGSPHVFKAEHLPELREIFDKWIKSLD